MATQITKKPILGALQKEEGLASMNSAGALHLPNEFDQNRFAGQWTEKAKVPQFMGKQYLPQTTYSAQGWAVWKYPKEVPTGKQDEKGKSEMTAHPNADQPCEVVLSKITYQLMFRPKEVQDDVNLAYSLLSQERVESEVNGFTVDGAPAAPGMLTEKDLSRVLGKEVEIESDGTSGETRQIAMHGLRASKHLEGKRVRVSR